MAGRYPTVDHFSFCYEPKKISKNGLTMYVPCGKCNGCLLQKSNSWSFRLGDEIECSENAIFFTLTYSNRYVPKMYCSVENGEFHWRSYKDNVRFNGRFDVPREPLDFYSKFTLKAPLKNYGDDKCIGYLCKSDIQLWLKLLRKDIYEHYNISSGSFRTGLVSLPIRESSGRTITDSSSLVTVKSPRTSCRVLSIRIGRCVIIRSLNSTRNFAIQEYDITLRNTLLALLSFRRFCRKSRKLSLLGLVPRKQELSVVCALTQRKYSKTSNAELMNIISRSTELNEIIYFCIPRRLSIPYSLNVVDSAYFLLNDYIGFMDTYLNSAKGCSQFLPYLMDWLVSQCRTIKLPRRALRRVTL